MALLTFDTYDFVQNLKAAGFPEPQARALVEGLKQVELEQVATKDDVRQLAAATKEDIQTVRTEIQAVRSELKEEIQVVRTEIQTVRSELKGEIQAVKAELLKEIGGGKTELLKWTIVLFATQTTAMLGGFLALFFKLP